MPDLLYPSLRYEAINRCLRDPDHVYHLDDLIEACSQYILERKGEARRPSKRTLYNDLKRMKSGDLGYHAPIAHTKERGYYYSIPDFSIHKMVFDRDMVTKLSEASIILQEFMENNHLTDLAGTMIALREKLNVQLDPAFTPAVHIEKSPNIIRDGLVNQIYRAIHRKICLTIRYAPFDKEEEMIYLSPYFIKEYNNRWYVIGYDHEKESLINPALDRILSITESLRAYDDSHMTDYKKLYEHVYGVTIPQGAEPVEIRFWAKRFLSYYLDTKPIHPSQMRVKDTRHGVIYSLHLFINYEIKHRLLSYGADITILSPRSLRNWMKGIVQQLIREYPRRRK